MTEIRHRTTAPRRSYRSEVMGAVHPAGAPGGARQLSGDDAQCRHRVLEAIFWKPEFRWVPVKIEVLRPIQQFSLRRNETHDLASLSDAVKEESPHRHGGQS